MSSKEVDRHLAKISEPHRSTLQQLRTSILELIPDAEEVILMAFQVTN